MHRAVKTASYVRQFTTNLRNRTNIQRLAEDTTVSLSIDRCPSGFRLQANHVDWTDKFKGSAGALQIALESRTATLPVGHPGVYIRSTRLSNLQGEDVYFFVCQKSTAGLGSVLFKKAPRVSCARIRSTAKLSEGNVPSRQLYGRPLAHAMSNGELPDIIQQLQAYLQRDACIRVEGLFRVPAPADALQTAQLEIDRGEIPECLQREEEAVELDDVHLAAGLYKLFFRRMPQPLIPWDSYNTILNKKEPHDIVQAFRDQVQRWPLERRKCMEALLRFLTIVARYAEFNKMPADNLATVFAPSLLRQQNASPMDDLTSIKDRVMRVKCLLRNYKSVFQSESDVDTKVIDL